MNSEIFKDWIGTDIIQRINGEKTKKCNCCFWHKKVKMWNLVEIEIFQKAFSKSDYCDKKVDYTA